MNKGQFFAACARLLPSTNFVPIIGRELRLRANRPATYWARFVVALVGLLVSVPLLTLGAEADPAQAGKFAFTGMIVGAFLLGCAACLLTADVISAERRDGTLGLLFLTRVKSFDILLGKLVSVGWTAVSGLLAFLPLLMVPVLAGAVTGREVFFSAFALLNLLFLSLVVGLFASVSRLESVAAARRALFLLAVVILAPAFLEGIFRAGGARTSALGLISPLVSILDANRTGGPGTIRFLIALLFGQACGWLLLATTNRKLRESLCEQITGSELRIESLDRPVITIPYRSPGDAEPIQWAVRRQSGFHRLIWAGACFGIGFSAFVILIYQLFVYPPSGFFGMMIEPFYLAVALTIKGLFARAASRFLFEARRTGQLELLLTTPHGAKAILSGQWHALIRVMRLPVGIAVIAEILSNVSTIARESAQLNPVHFWGFLVSVTCFLEAVTTVAGISAACWLGMAFGIRGQTPLPTMAKTAGLTAGIPFLFQIGATFALADPLSRVFASDFELWIYLDWGIVLFSTLYYAWLIHWARSRVLTELHPR